MNISYKNQMKTTNYEDCDYSSSPVKDKAKKGWGAIIAIMIGYTLYSGTMLVGGQIGAAASMKTIIISFIVGNLILATFAGVLAYISARTSLSTHLLARYAYGEKGSYIVSFVLGITQLGWFGIGIIMLAKAINHIITIPFPLLVIILGLLMVGSALFGIKTLTLVSYIGVPVILLFGMVSMKISISKILNMDPMLASNAAISLPLAINMVIGTFISGATLTPDFVRFSKNAKVAVVSTTLAFGLINTLMLAWGAVGAIAFGLSDVSDVMISQGLIIPGILVLTLNIWTSNDNGLYASSLGFSNITGIPKKKIVVVNGSIAIVMSQFIYDNLSGFLSFLSGLVPGIGVIIIMDYFMNCEKYKGNFYNRGKKFVNYSAVMALLASTVSGLVTEYSSIVSIIIAAVSFGALQLFIKIKNYLHNDYDNKIIE